MIKSLQTTKTNTSRHVPVTGIIEDFRFIISVCTGVFNHGNVPGISRPK